MLPHNPPSFSGPPVSGCGQPSVCLAYANVRLMDAGTCRPANPNAGVAALLKPCGSHFADFINGVCGGVGVRWP